MNLMSEWLITSMIFMLVVVGIALLAEIVTTINQLRS